MNDTNPNGELKTFEPRDDNERQVARINRMQLNYWVLRTMIERNRAAGLAVSPLMIAKAKEVRVQAFRDEVDLVDQGLKLAPNQPMFDDERLNQTGTRIAYFLLSAATNFEAGEPEHAVRALNQAFACEEQVITLEVYRALYDVDLLDQRLAA
jgi:hypothetical protein